MSKVVVIGGGVSGVISSIYASKNNEVIILERNNELLKKLLITGNGRCNYFNDNQNINNYNSNNMELLSNIINEKNINELKRFYEEIGIVPKIKNGYYYPYSNQAISVKNALINKLNDCNVNVILNYMVNEIKKDNNKFIINNDIICDKVIISTGGMSYPITGSDGNGYNLLKKFNLRISDINPSLTPLVCNDKYLKKLSGVRCEAKISIYSDKKLLSSDIGELQLTDYGVSGICVFNISNSFYKDTNNKTVHINFMPFIETKDELINYLNKRDKIMNYKKISELLNGILNNKIINVIINKLNFNDIKYKSLDDNEKNILCENIINYTMKVTSTKSFDKSQVTSGGLYLDELDSNMQCKNIKNLYVVGEILDCDGICGGYNLTFAFLTSYLAGSSI